MRPRPRCPRTPGRGAGGRRARSRRGGPRRARRSGCRRRRTSAVRLAELLELEPENPVAADDAEAAQTLRAEPVDVLRRAREHRLAAALAEERELVVREVELGAHPAPERRLPERDREPAAAGVVREREQGRRAPEEPDERRL